MRIPLRFALPTLLLACVGQALAGDDEKVKKAAREVRGKFDAAVVGVKVAGITYVVMDGKAGPKVDFGADLTGTVLSAGGMTAICNLSSDFENQAPPIGFKQVFEIGDIKLILKDGREIAGELVMRDPKAGVAFVAPKRRDLKLDHVAVEKGTLPEALDSVIVLNRLGEPLKRQSELFITPVTSVIKDSQTLVVGALEGGSAVFDASGRPLGVIVMRRARDQKGIPLDSPLAATVATAESLRPALAQATKKWEAGKN